MLNRSNHQLLIIALFAACFVTVTLHGAAKNSPTTFIEKLALVMQQVKDYLDLAKYGSFRDDALQKSEQSYTSWVEDKKKEWAAYGKIDIYDWFFSR